MILLFLSKVESLAKQPVSLLTCSAIGMVGQSSYEQPLNRTLRPGSTRLLDAAHTLILLYAEDGYGSRRLRHIKCCERVVWKKKRTSRFS